MTKQAQRVSRRVIRETERIYEIPAGGRLRINTWDAELGGWTVEVDENVSHQTTVKISLVEHV